MLFVSLGIYAQAKSDTVDYYHNTAIGLQLHSASGSGLTVRFPIAENIKLQPAIIYLKDNRSEVLDAGLSIQYTLRKIKSHYLYLYTGGDYKMSRTTYANPDGDGFFSVNAGVGMSLNVMNLFEAYVNVGYGAYNDFNSFFLAGGFGLLFIL